MLFVSRNERLAPVVEHGFRRDIAGLRALAVMLVVLNHLGVPGFHGGFIGVDVFFVISGYLITRKIIEDVSEGKFTFRAFYLARLRRIYPALVVTILGTIAIGAVVLAPARFYQLAWDSIAAVGSFSNITFWLQTGYFDQEASTKPLLHTWSLGVEEQFYLIWPLVLTLAVPRLNRLGLIALMVAVVLTGTALAQGWLGIDASAAFYLLPFRMGEFAIGALITLLPIGRVAMAARDLLYAAGIILIGWSAWSLSAESAFPGISAFIPAAGAALCIFAGQSRASAPLQTGPAVWIGNISYALYLVHWPIIVFAYYWMMRPLDGLEIGLALAVMLAVAAAMWAGVEQPFRKRTGGRYIISGTRVVTTAFGGGLLSAVIAVGIIAGEGLPFRAGGTIQGMENVADARQFHLTYYGGIRCRPPSCVLGPEAAEEKVYVLGDSHARSLYAGLQSVFPDTRFMFFAPDACPMYDLDPEAGQRSSHVPRCEAGRSEAYALLQSDPAPVILLQHWSNTMGGEFNQRRAEVANTKIHEFRDFLPPEVPMVVIGGTPRFSGGLTLLDCVGRPFGGDDCLTSDVGSNTLSVHRGFNDIIEASASDYTVLDPFDVFCEGSACSNVDAQGRPVYSDWAHLTRWGSVELVEGLRDELRDGLGLHQNLSTATAR